jgi:hypothetical protein
LRSGPNSFSHRTPQIFSFNASRNSAGDNILSLKKLEIRNRKWEGRSDKCEMERRKWELGSYEIWRSYLS